MLRVIKLLSDGEFHSGEELGKYLNLSRSAVWKLIKQLQALDVEVETRTGRGYRIPNGIKLLDANLIKNSIEAPQLERLVSIDILQSLSSTMDYFNLNGGEVSNILSSFEQLSMEKSKEQSAKEPLVEESLAKEQTTNHSFGRSTLRNRVCFAERQTKGRGRLGREWVSPFAKNIYLSLLWHFPKDLSELSGLSLAVATAVIKTLKRFHINEGLGLKWPNDVLYKNQKLAGVLIELSGETHNISRTVIGIGLNVLQPKACSAHHNKISQPWIDMQSISEQLPDRNLIAGDLVNELIKTTVTFETEGLAPFLDYWRSQDLSYSKPVTICCQGTALQGKGLGINNQGCFLLETVTGEIKSFSNGEVSLRLV